MFQLTPSFKALTIAVHTKNSMKETKFSKSEIKVPPGNVLQALLLRSHGIRLKPAGSMRGALLQIETFEHPLHP